MPISPDQTGETPPDEVQVTEVTFEVTVRHFVLDDSPNPSDEDIRVGIERHLAPNFDLESVRVERI